ncbi:N-acetylglucosaminidase [Anaerostipes caccae]|uniref:N-acetylglucosaminidase n=1 Tax=Anaerostipes caccae TaxID=105841 RepID=UPI0038D359BD
MRKKGMKILAMSAVLSISMTASVFAGSLSLRYSGKNRTYKGKQLTFYYKGKKINLGKAPGIQINKVNMLPYYNAIVKNGPKVKRSYNKKTGKLVLTNGKKTITFYKNKKYAYTNGVKRTFTTAPLTVKYRSINKNYILLPAKFTAKYLGISYTYSSSAKRIDYAKPAAASKPDSTVKSNTTTKYNTTLTNYIKKQQAQWKTYGGKTIDYKKYIPVTTDNTNSFQFLRLDTYHPVNTSKFSSTLQTMVSKKTGSVLSGKASVITNAASTYNIDPLYFLCQTIHESGYGTSTLAKGKAVTQVITGDSLSPKGATGTKVTAFKTVSKDVKTAGEKKGKKYYKVNNNAYYEVKNISSKKVYNLYGIKAYDNAPQLGGFSYAYYQGWTSVDKAIQGAAKYVSDNYIHHGTYKQNTLYKIRYSPYLQDLGHQYASDPAYAQSIGKLMNTYQSVYSSTSGFIYDTPVFN